MEVKEDGRMLPKDELPELGSEGQTGIVTGTARAKALWLAHP